MRWRSSSRALFARKQGLLKRGIGRGLEGGSGTLRGDVASARGGSAETIDHCIEGQNTVKAQVVADPEPEVFSATKAWHLRREQEETGRVDVRRSKIGCPHARPSRKLIPMIRDKAELSGIAEAGTSCTCQACGRMREVSRLHRGLCCCPCAWTVQADANGVRQCHVSPVKGHRGRVARPVGWHIRSTNRAATVYDGTEVDPLALQLPPAVRAVLWDVDPQAVTEAQAAFLIERVLEWGDADACRWLLSTFKREEVERVVRASPRLSRMSARFWAIYLGVPPESVQKLAHSGWVAR